MSVAMPKHRYWILDGHSPVPVDDVRVWGKWFEEIEQRRVDHTEFDGGYVSTVFLGLDHNFSGHGGPLLFETMIFGGPESDYQERYETWDEAVAGHALAVEIAAGGRRKEP